MQVAGRTLLDRLCGRGAGAEPPRVLVVAAHPDDEVIGAGAQLPQWKGVTVVHVTDGSPRNEADAQANGFADRAEYARARRQELLAALGLAGIGPERTREVGLTDQEASHHLSDLAWTLAHLFRREQPEAVVTHPYEGGHPDHDATAFGVHTACRILAHRGEAAPRIIEMTSYHNSGGAMSACSFLPNGESEPVVVTLADGERGLKELMLACFASQQQVLAPFSRDREAFRPAPRYDFEQPPHDGVLYYEMFDWGMTGDRWRSLAGEACESLRI